VSHIVKSLPEEHST